MARSGIDKSAVQKARDSLLAQGQHPSIDAIRAELGNTGSKTTIHRYLKELEEEEGGRTHRHLAVSEALQDLIGRLAQRLHEEADARIAKNQSETAYQLAQRDEAMAMLQKELEGLSVKLEQSTQTLSDEQTVHQQIRQAYQSEVLKSAQQIQQLAGLQAQLSQHQAFCQSLEEKHQHARKALEHYRESTRVQREQEQHRHAQQVEQLQAELRTLNQTLIVKQNELTRAYQETTQVTTELVHERNMLRRREEELEKANQARDALWVQNTTLEANAATLTERLQQLSTNRDELWQLFQDKLATMAVAYAQSREDKQEGRLDLT